MTVAPLTVRHPEHDFSAEAPRYWADGDVFRTHLLNAFSMIFPGGERYLLRPMLTAAEQLGDADTRALVKSFAGQESQHAVEHQRSLAVLRAQGFEVDGYVGALDRFFRRIEKHMSLRANLCLIAGVEHIATQVGDLFLRKNFDEGTPRELGSLFAWHAMEELEHRSVAFDVMQRFGARYGHRAFWFAVALIAVPSLFTAAMILLSRQDKTFRWTAFLRGAWGFMAGGRGWDPRFFFALARYFVPGFHPSRDTHAEAFAIGERYPFRFQFFDDRRNALASE